jgi:RecA-family ATPase
MSDWDTTPVPAREWGVRGLIPMRQPTLFSGEGAVGKSIVELQLCCAHVIDHDWIGHKTESGPAIYLGAEDETDELRRRLADIAKHYETTFAQLIAGGLHLLSFAGEDCLLGVPERSGRIMPTPLFNLLFEAARDIKPRHIGIDTSADVFGGNEIDRNQVRQFVSLLRKLAIAANSSLVLLSHPSLQGINSGTGLSGSTSWHNSVRSRFYMRSMAETDEAADSDREIVFKKLQYGSLPPTVTLRWRDGLFLPLLSEENLDELAATAVEAENVFLHLLDRFNRDERNASPNVGPSYAPALFADEAEAKTLKNRNRALAEAMRRLFADNKIHVEQYGRPSRPYGRLRIGPKGS